MRHFDGLDYGGVDAFSRVTDGVGGLVHVTQNKDRVHQNDGEENAEQCDADGKNDVEKIEGREHGREIREILARYKIGYLMDYVHCRGEPMSPNKFFFEFMVRDVPLGLLTMTILFLCS